MSWKSPCRLVFLAILASNLPIVYSFIDGLYCGRDNCYDILDVTRDSTKGEITKAYRKLARKWHPDMHKGKEAKEKASEMFQKIANAYEILKDEEQRTDYNYMLDNPDEYYSHYFYYYRRRVQPKVDVRIVIAVSITVISVVQYWSAVNNYNSAINYLSKEPKYRLRAQQIAKEENLFVTNKKELKRKSKEEIRENEETVIKKVIAEKMDIRGGYRKPKITDVLWIQLFMLPYYIVIYIAWWIKWVWKFNIKREEYGEGEKLYLIRKYMKCSQAQFDSIEEAEKEKYLRLQLWIKDKYQAWKTQQEEEMKIKLAESSRYKMYRRYMKKGGPGQMTFGPD